MQPTSLQYGDLQWPDMDEYDLTHSHMNTFRSIRITCSLDEVVGVERVERDDKVASSEQGGYLACETLQDGTQFVCIISCRLISGAI